MSIDSLQKTITPIAEKYGVRDVFLFGSVAKGTDTEKSDIDLRVNAESLSGFFALCGFYTELETALNRKIDLVTTNSLDKDFRDSIAKDEVFIC